MNQERVLLGEWDGEPIWRKKTAEEKFVAAFQQKIKEKTHHES